MAKVGYVVYEVTAHVLRRKDEYRPLDDLDGNGADTLQDTEAILKALSDELSPQIEERYEQAFDVQGFHRSGRAITIQGSAGPYGTAGNLTNVDSGDRRRYGARDATMIDLRAMLIIPTGERVGLLFCERKGARHLKNIIERHVLKKIGVQQNVRFDVLPFVDPKAWEKFLDSAQTYEISYIYRSTRLEDLAPERRSAGDLRMTVTGGVARRIGRAFRSVLSQMTEGRDRAADGHSGVVVREVPHPAELTPRDEEHFDHERVEMQVGHDNTKRTIVIERGQLPQFIYELEKDLVDDALWGRFRDHAANILSDLGSTLG
ncbi:hypothetical protein [Planomonospora parontospora]|uniref:hypothetical protein n=1 Tax=Planomonospora parontospora TaxID=58119 RepID=UPI001670EDB4|nr:hypothetical protein [Planomonospora parontospora]GGL42248.1 hypothetical protein GCM10014719_49450 [Planomonospora parontospora subsp. antibiotica]GII18416.1 hypothetical protein Ppa05_51420 [Planomonospora parontospora subsp. antibiotica]